MVWWGEETAGGSEVDVSLGRWRIARGPGGGSQVTELSIRKREVRGVDLYDLNILTGSVQLLC